MKTVSGEVISSKSISLKKAARTLSNFASSDNGASPAFSAYLKRAVASFNELVLLHTESKSLGSECKVKKRRSMDIACEGTVGSVINSGDEGLAMEIEVSERKESRRANKGEGEAGRIDVKTEVQNVEGIIDRNVVDVRGAGKKLKKKREDNETVTIENEPYDDFDAIKVNGLKNETESFDGSLDIEKKKKKKRDKIERENHNVAVDVVMEAHSLPHSENLNNEQAIEIDKKSIDKQRKHKNDQPYSDQSPVLTIEVKNEIECFDRSIEMKKKKKKNKNEIEIKEKRVSSSSGINGDEQSNEIRGNVENVDKNKRTHEGKERKNEGKLEIEAANKESRKRKHESVTTKELDNSQEQHKSKKKKR